MIVKITISININNCLSFFYRIKDLLFYLKEYGWIYDNKSKFIILN